MTPSTYNLDIYHGDSGHCQFRLYNDSGKTQPTDLTGFTVKAEIRDASGSPYKVPMACTITLPNTIDMLLSATSSRQLYAGTMVWDLQFTDGGGAVTTLLGGNVVVHGDVTDSEHQ